MLVDIPTWKIKKYQKQISQQLAEFIYKKSFANPPEIEDLKNNQTSSFSFLQEALKLIAKIALVNDHFMIAMADNTFNVNKFNEFSIKQEFLKQLYTAFNKEFYIKAFTKSQIIALSKNNSFEFDIKKYNNFINELHELVKDDENDIES